MKEQTHGEKYHGQPVAGELGWANEADPSMLKRLGIMVAVMGSATVIFLVGFAVGLSVAT